MQPCSRRACQNKQRGQGVGGRQVAQRANRGHDDVKEGRGDGDHAAQGNADDTCDCPGWPAAPLLPILFPGRQRRVAWAFRGEADLEMMGIASPWLRTYKKTLFK